MISSAAMATIGQLLRSGQRDDQYVNQLNEELNELIHYWFGVRNWMKIRQHLPQMSHFLYYSVTTLSGLQTLGEEYVNIVQTDGNRVLVPKLLKRFLTIVLQTFSPYLLSTLVSDIRRRIEKREIVLPTVLDSIERRDQFLSLLSLTEESFQLVLRFHLISFYLNSNYYHLSKRVANIKYISLNGSASQRTDSRAKTIYRFLGYLTLSQLLISLLIRFYSLRKSSNNRNEDNFETRSESSLKSSEVSVSQRCSLCLEVRRQTTATSCGHLFCWHCIAEWLQHRTDCPLCRQPLKHSTIVLLNNYL